jgi:cytochrome o ubiquinol oxidase subunit IV
LNHIPPWAERPTVAQKAVAQDARKRIAEDAYLAILHRIAGVDHQGALYPEKSERCVAGIRALRERVGGPGARTDQSAVAARVPAGLAVLAIAQMGVHLVFFLQIGTGPDNNNDVLALAFGLLVVTLIVAGSLWIMAHLNANMMPASAIMEMQR